MRPPIPLSSNSDDEFGGDFSAEEVAIIDQLLIEANSQHVPPPLAVAELDDNAGQPPLSAVVPLSSRQRRQQERRSNGARQASSNGAPAAEGPSVRIQYDVEGWVGAQSGVPATFRPLNASTSYGQPLATTLNSTSNPPSVSSPSTNPATLNDHPSTPSATSPNNEPPPAPPSPLGSPLKSFLKPSSPRAGLSGTLFPNPATAAAAQSPLSRFRPPDRKPLSVTDLISPAWCELQYYFTLTRFGRKRPTLAMRKGSEVHRKLEERVHKRVEVTVESKEDAWGLRVWNLLQALRSLREEGVAREVEVWGIIGDGGGEVVGGVVDEVSLGPQEERAGQRLFCITDVKTRGSKTIPSGAGFRPTLYQLMLYRRMLGEMADGKLDFGRVWARYGVSAEKAFSDAFLVAMGALDAGSSEDEFGDGGEEAFFDAPDSSQPNDESLFSSQESGYSMPGSFHASDFLAEGDEPPSSPSSQNPQPQEHPPPRPSSARQSPEAELLPSFIFLHHPTLSSLLPLLQSHLRLTFPHGSADLSNTLRAEYRDKNTGEITGSRALEMDEAMLDSYVADTMAWWKGNREARGVSMKEGWKCGGCEFNEDCDWRAEMERKWREGRGLGVRGDEGGEEKEKEREGGDEEGGRGEGWRRTRSYV